LAAIQICLGAHARRTHRARNLKELVRKESSNSGAKVRVTLLNGGEDGYKRETYGDSITIERSITIRGGYNGYRLLDHEGKERSRSKKDLEAMLDQLNIQVDNPVAVLDQEEAKKFLTGRPQDKYDFFAKATELERIDNTYAGTVDNLVELDEQNTKNKENLSSVYTNVKTLKDQWKQFEELDKLQEKIGDLSVQLTWSMYHQQNEKADQNETFLRDILEKREKRSQDLAKAEELANVTEDEETSLRDQMTRLTEEAQEAAAAKRGIEAELKEVMAPAKSREREAASIRREVITATKRLKRAQKDLQAVRDQITKTAGNAESEEARRVEKLEKAEAELARKKDGIEVQKEAINEYLKKYEDIKPHVDQASENTQSISGQINAVNHKLRDLQSTSGGNSFTVFGQKCDVMHDLVSPQLLFLFPLIS
jgi:chromosome segregation ATPase